MTKDPVFFVNVLPANDRREDPRYVERVRETAESGETARFRYTLVTTGHQRHDPWALAQFGMERSPAFSPLIAVNPAYQHPLQAAKRLVTLRSLYPNRIGINLVTGSFSAERRSMRDELDFSARNDRLLEFLRIFRELTGQSGISAEGGRYFPLRDAEIYPKAGGPGPDIFISGSFAGSGEVAAGPTFFVKNIRPWASMEKAETSRSGLGLGIVARPTDEEAITEARRIFPANQKGEMLFALSLRNSDTPWNEWLRPYVEKGRLDDPEFYLPPLRGFWSSAPFVVGSYENVTRRLRQYQGLGYAFFLLDYASGDAPHAAECLARLLPSMPGDGRAAD